MTKSSHASMTNMENFPHFHFLNEAIPLGIRRQHDIKLCLSKKLSLQIFHMKQKAKPANRLLLLDQSLVTTFYVAIFATKCYFKA